MSQAWQGAAPCHPWLMSCGVRIPTSPSKCCKDSAEESTQQMNILAGANLISPVLQAPGSPGSIKLRLGPREGKKEAVKTRQKACEAERCGSTGVFQSSFTATGFQQSASAAARTATCLLRQVSEVTAAMCTCRTCTPEAEASHRRPKQAAAPVGALCSLEDAHHSLSAHQIRHDLGQRKRESKTRREKGSTTVDKLSKVGEPSAPCKEQKAASTELHGFQANRQPGKLFRTSSPLLQVAPAT